MTQYWGQTLGEWSTRGDTNWRDTPDVSCWQWMQQPLEHEGVGLRHVRLSRFLSVTLILQVVIHLRGLRSSCSPQSDGMHLGVTNFSQGRHEYLCGIAQFWVSSDGR